MIWPRVRSFAATAGLAALTFGAQASLIVLGDGTVKDTATNLIWLQNWNDTGALRWSDQELWATTLSFRGHDDWALPSIEQFADLFAELGDLSLVAEFTNVQRGRYWSGTETAPGVSAWTLRAATGELRDDNEAFGFFAVAVRPGDVGAAVPEPTTLALVLLGLSAFGVARGRPSP